MIAVSFESWIESLRRAADREGVSLDASDESYRHYYEQGDTPRGALIDLVEFPEG